MIISGEWISPYHYLSDTPTDGPVDRKVLRRGATRLRDRELPGGSKVKAHAPNSGVGILFGHRCAGDADSIRRHRGNRNLLRKPGPADGDGGSSRSDSRGPA